MTQKIVVKQVKSVISRNDNQRKIMISLGLRGIGKVRTHKDTNCIRGMINKVKHLVSYEIVSE